MNWLISFWSLLLLLPNIYSYYLGYFNRFPNYFPTFRQSIYWLQTSGSCVNIYWDNILIEHLLLWKDWAWLLLLYSFNRLFACKTTKTGYFIFEMFIVRNFLSRYCLISLFAICCLLIICYDSQRRKALRSLKKWTEIQCELILCSLFNGSYLLF